MNTSPLSVKCSSCGILFRVLRIEPIPLTEAIFNYCPICKGQVLSFLDEDENIYEAWAKDCEVPVNIIKLLWPIWQERSREFPGFFAFVRGVDKGEIKL